MLFDDEAIGNAGDLLSRLSRFYPAARLRIPTSRLWFRDWQREVTRVRALPLPARVVQGLAGIALVLKRKHLAALLPLGFLCMLRTGELLGLRPMDITFSPHGSTAIVALHQTKTSGPNTEDTVLEDVCGVFALKPSALT